MLRPPVQTVHVTRRAGLPRGQGASSASDTFWMSTAYPAPSIVRTALHHLTAKGRHSVMSSLRRLAVETVARVLYASIFGDRLLRGALSGTGSSERSSSSASSQTSRLTAWARLLTARSRGIAAMKRRGLHFSPGRRSFLRAMRRPFRPASSLVALAPVASRTTWPGWATASWPSNRSIVRAGHAARLPSCVRCGVLSRSV